MAIGQIRLSTQVRRGVPRSGAGATAARAGSIAAAGAPRLVEPPRIDLGAEQLGSLANMLGEWATLSAARDDERTLQKAQLELQRKVSDIDLPLLDKRGLDAANAADDFDKQTKGAFSEISSQLNPKLREAFAMRTAPWLAGRRENIIKHALSQYRQGRRDEIEASLDEMEDMELADTVALARSYQDMDIGDDAARKEFWKDNAQNLLVQIGATGAANAAELYTSAINEGLLTKEEAEAKAKKRASRSVKALMNTLIADGNTHAADAILDEFDAKETREGLTKATGIGADEVAAMRRAVASRRDALAAEGRQQAADALREAKANAANRELDFARNNPFPEDEKLLPDYFTRMRDVMRNIANDPENGLDDKTRLEYHAAADRLTVKKVTTENAQKEAAERLDIRQRAAEAQARQDQIKMIEKGFLSRWEQLALGIADKSLSAQQVSEETSKIYRELVPLVKDGQVSTDFMKKMRLELTHAWTEEEKYMAKRFFDFFGYTGERDDRNEPTKRAIEKKAKKEYKAQTDRRKTGAFGGSSVPTIKGANLFAYWQDLKNIMSRYRGEDRIKNLDTELERLKKDWNFDSYADGITSRVTDFSEQLQAMSLANILTGFNETDADRKSKASGENEKKSETKKDGEN